MKNQCKQAISRELLTKTYRELFDVLNKDENLFTKVYEHYKGDTLTFSMHKYDRNKVAEYIKNANEKELTELSARFQYSKRWMKRVRKTGK